MRQAAVFLDRDGTLNERPADHQWITTPDDFHWIPGSARGVARLSEAGYVLAIASNQRGVARGHVDRGTLRAIEDLIQRGLAEHGCEIAAFAYCPHDIESNCHCRKPRPGMIVSLARDLDVDLRRSWMIGDSASDVLAGRAAGCHTVLIGSSPQPCEPDLVAPSLDAASGLIAKSDEAQEPGSVPPASNSSTRA